MSTEPEGVESDSEAVVTANASRFMNGAARKSETLADSEAQDLVINLSVSDDETETRNGFCYLEKKSEFVDVVEKNGDEIENDSAEIQKVCSNGDNLCNRVDGEKRDLVENLKLYDSDMVWAKVRSYPWWPGQLFDSSLATKKAKKYYKKGNSLVMYFGDSTFAWNDSSCIKPFHQFFSQMVNQSKTTEFRNAVDCALEEVSRRVEFGLSCSCISHEVYDKLKTQKIMNPGIRADSSCVRDNKLSNAVFFKPAKVSEYLKDLACFPSYDVSDKLWFVINRAQLLAFQEWRSYLDFPKYESFIKSVESAAPEASLPEPNEEEMSLKKRETDCEDSFGFEDKTDEKTKKKKTLSDFIAKKRFEKSQSEKKRKAESLESSKIKNKKMEKPKHNEEIAPIKISSSDDDEMISSLHADKIGKEIITESSISNDPWNYENFVKELSCSNNLNDYSKKTTIINETSSESWNVNITGSGSKEQTGFFKDSSTTSDSLPATALILNFADSGSVPSIEKLNKIFNRYGSLIESETKVIKKNGKRVKVVFERSEDAKTAFSSAGKYSIFGPSLLSYKLKYVCIKTKQRNKNITKT